MNTKVWFLVSVSVLCLSACSSKETMSGAGEPPPTLALANDAAAANSATAPTPNQAEPVDKTSDLQTVYFGYDDAALNGATRDMLKKNAAWMKGHKGSAIQLEGHCDQRGTTEYNLALGERRAAAAKQFLMKLGVAANRISTISYGAERPASNGHDEGAYAQNRRAVSVILSGGSQASNR